MGGCATTGRSTVLPVSYKWRLSASARPVHRCLKRRHRAPLVAREEAGETSGASVRQPAPSPMTLDSITRSPGHNPGARLLAIPMLMMPLQLAFTATRQPEGSPLWATNMVTWGHDVAQYDNLAEY
jgi:hypothetical protein